MSNNPLYSSIRHALVLIVEPTTSFCRSLSRAFQNTGVKLLAAENGQDALTIIHGLGMPVLAVIDILLPDMSGLELAAKLKQHKDIPIILTGYCADPNQIASMLDLIAEDFVAKPADEREIVARALRLLLRCSKPLNVVEENAFNDHSHSFVKRAQRLTH